MPTNLEKKWDSKFIQVNLEHELYPDDLFKDRFIILTKSEIKELQYKTIRRIRLYNKKYKPKGHAGYSGYGTQ